MSKLKSVVPWDKADSATVVRLLLLRDNDETDIYTVQGNDTPHARLATIGKNGLRRATNVPERLGFPLDDKGRIKLDE